MAWETDEITNYREFVQENVSMGINPFIDSIRDAEGNIAYYLVTGNADGDSMAVELTHDTLQRLILQLAVRLER